MPSTSPLGSREFAPFPPLKGLPPMTGSSAPSPFYRHSDYYPEYQREAVSPSQNLSSSISSGSYFEEDGDDDATRSNEPMSELPKDLNRIYERLVPVLAYDQAALMRLVSVSLLARNNQHDLTPYPLLLFPPMRALTGPSQIGTNA